MAMCAGTAPTDDKAARRWPRYKVSVPVRVFTHIPMNVAEGWGTALNCGGMTLRGGIALTVGEQVEVEFTPPSLPQALRLRCFVRDHDGDGFGLEFITENDDDYAAVGRLEATLQGVGQRLA